MELSERKKMILQAIVEDYIATAEPVGSRSIAKNHDWGLSPATIRNEMADLEESGYLDKPHTSAGRVPSELGYRFYVDSLMQRYSLTIDEIARLQETMDSRFRRLEGVISDISEVISKITHYPTVVQLPKERQGRIQNVKLLLTEPTTALLVVITDGGLVKNRQIRLENPVNYELIDHISDFLQTQLAGLAAVDFTPARLMLIYEAMGGYGDFGKSVLQFVISCLQEEANRIYIGGAANILEQPEFNDIERAKEFLGFIDERENLTRVLGTADEEDHVAIKIGSETGEDAMRDSALVVLNYSVGEKLRGKIGIIGPKRMDYARIVSSLELINNRLSDILYRLYYEDDQ